MKIKKLKIDNFRSYETETEIELGNLNVFVGKNDAGKSSILEALDIFFNENKGTIKIDKDDVNKKLKSEDNTCIKISVVFEDLPSHLTIDTSNSTTLADEFLLQADGTLEIVKHYPNAGKEKVFIRANHPTNPECSDLLLKKNTELKKLLTDEMVCSDKTKNADIRKAIWEHYGNDLNLQETLIEISKIDAKNTWEQLKKYMPLYTLFQSDRKNSDGDNEVQDPMKIAVNEILRDSEIRESLNAVASKVEEKLTIVSKNTLEKLNEMNPEIANSLNPNIPPADNLKWNDVFKSVSISCDEDIPINKRGSGVKRLILLNFFRAEAERRKIEENIPNVIFAVEEPETSQHPSHQRKLIEAFKELSDTDNTQILMTTHSPEIVKLLNFEHLQLVKNDSIKEVVNVQQRDLPYPSLNEVNFLAFSESNDEYHNELYGFIESAQELQNYKSGKETREYNQLQRNGNLVSRQIVLSEYIRHQIHHPENTHNIRFTNEELHQSISDMREFIKSNNFDM